MSNNFTPAPTTTVNVCPQSPAPVFCCTATIVNPVNTFYTNDAKRRPASFFLRYKSKRKQFANRDDTRSVSNDLPDSR